MGPDLYKYKARILRVIDGDTVEAVSASNAEAQDHPLDGATDGYTVAQAVRTQVFWVVVTLYALMFVYRIVPIFDIQWTLTPQGLHLFSSHSTPIQMNRLLLHLLIANGGSSSSCGAV